MTKQCTKCRKWKRLSEFHKLKSGKHGLHPSCKKCRNKQQQKYRQTEKGRQAHAKNNKKYEQTFSGYLRHRFNLIKTRCNNPKHSSYKWYGGRGIKCLFKSPDDFVNYVINELKINPRGLQIDRIDNNGHYEPGNIRFTTAKVNANNRRNSKK